jgi:hypothetical protein
MSRYVQASTANPFGHTPWQTALYTTFGDFAWLKHPQNYVEREPASIRPRIRKPPELAGVTIVGGSGRILGTLGNGVEEARFASLWRMAGGTPFALAPAAQLPPRTVTPTTPLRVAPIDVSPNVPIRVVTYPTTPGGAPQFAAPTPVATADGTITSYLPGAPGAAGSPFAGGLAAPAAAPGLVDQFKALLSASAVGGIPNYVLVIGAGALLFLRTPSKGRF